MQVFPLQSFATKLWRKPIHNLNKNLNMKKIIIIQSTIIYLSVIVSWSTCNNLPLVDCGFQKYPIWRDLLRIHACLCQKPFELVHQYWYFILSKLLKKKNVSLRHKILQWLSFFNKYTSSLRTMSIYRYHLEKYTV